MGHRIDLAPPHGHTGTLVHAYAITRRVVPVTVSIISKNKGFQLPEADLKRVMRRTGAARRGGRVFRIYRLGHGFPKSY